MQQSRSRETNCDDGFALIVVIWIGVFLALIAAAFSASVRSRIREAASHAEVARAEAFADAGVRIALLELANSGNEARGGKRFPPDGSTVFCAIPPDATLSIKIVDQDGKININTDNEDLLLALFEGLGASRSAARTYVDRIMDFRDADSERRSDGAEREDYAKVIGGHLPPKDADFLTVDELDQVLGIPPDVRDRAKPFLTAAATQSGVDPSVASSQLRAVLVRGTNGIDVAASDGSSFIASDLPQNLTAASSRSSYGIRAEAILPSSRYVSEVVAHLGVSSSRVEVRSWHRGITDETGIPPPFTKLPPC